MANIKKGLVEMPEMSAQEMWHQEQERIKAEKEQQKEKVFVENKVPDEFQQLMENLEAEQQHIKKDLEFLKAKNEGLSKRELMSVASDINKTLLLIGQVDEIGKMILDKKDNLMKLFNILRSSNRLDELHTEKDLIIVKMFAYIERNSTLYLALRNELEQLQSKIRLNY